MEEVIEVNSSPRTERTSFRIAAPPFRLQCSPSSTPSPLLSEAAPKTPMDTLGWHLMSSPLTSSPMKNAVASMRSYLDPQEAWLPITESRKGNAFYAAFHALNSGIGVQALLLPLAFTALGWSWGIICLSVAFAWQLYTLWLLIQLHEFVPGTRYSRYLRLSMAAFGEKPGKLLSLFPTLYLSSGTCVMLIVIGGGTMRIFFETVCGSAESPLTTTEWYLVFACFAIVMAQQPNLNSIAGVSLIGAVAAVGYCTLAWAVPISKDRPAGVSHGPLEKAHSNAARLRGILNALGIISFAFRGHNVVLEIQGTIPSSLMQPSRVPMWKGVQIAYAIIASCFFPLAIAGYWAYGNLMPATGGMLNALYKYHRHDTSKVILGLTSLLVVISSVGLFQIYGMVVFDNLEFKYTNSKQRPCPWWLRIGLRVFYGCLAFFISVALPFLRSLAGLLGGIALPVTLAYPCFMWILIRKPRKHGGEWYLNWILGCLGMILSFLVVTGAVWSIVTQGLEAHLFKPKQDFSAKN